MPFNFTKVQDTQSPEIAVNTLQQKSGSEVLGKMLVGVAEDVAETVQEKNNIETASNFNSDLSTFEQKLDDLNQASQLQRLEALQRRDQQLRDEDTSNDERARRSFADEISRINLREEQEGIMLESQKRSVVRKWSTIRPDMAEEFKKSIALNKALYELDRVGPRVDKRFEKFVELEQMSAATNIPIETLMRGEMTARQAKEAKDIYEAKDYAGRAAESDFFNYVNSTIDNGVEGMRGAYQRGINMLRSGKAEGVAYARSAITTISADLKAHVYKEQQAYAKTHNGVMPDMTKTLKYIDDFADSFLADLTPGVAIDIARLADVRMEDQQAAYIGEWLNQHGGFRFYGLDFARVPKITMRLATVVMDGLIKASEKGGVFDRLSKGQFPLVVEGARAGSVPDAALLSQIANMRTEYVQLGQRAKLNTEQLKLLETVLSGLSVGAIPPPEVAAEMGPLFATIMRGIANDPRISDEERKNARDAIKGNSWQSFPYRFRRSDILNPGSLGTQAIRDETDGEFEQHFNKYVEYYLYKPYSDLKDPYGSVVYDPTNMEAPFSNKKYKPHEITYNVSDKITIDKYVQDLNDAYTVRKNGRNAGNGHKWASGYHQKMHQVKEGQETPNVTSNVGTTSRVVITDEEFQSFLDEEKTPSEIVKGSGSGN